jgi:asparagine synthase (glutamine-hydrolysing)
VGGLVDFGNPHRSDLRTFSSFHSSPEFPHLSVIADASLHNAAELRVTLAQPEAGDSWQLILAAYVKWGQACSPFLLGEFSFALWDDRIQELFCCRDHLGLKNLFYWHRESLFAFSSSIERLLQFPPVPRQLNPRKFASLAVPTAHHYDDQETFHSGILSLPAGSCMTIKKGLVRQSTYWKPHVGDTWNPRRADDAYDALRDVLTQAVECRLTSDAPAVALLSGGLDSSAVVALAARCLEKQNRSLTTLSAVLPEGQTTTLTDERSYIDEFRSWPNVQIQYVTAPGRGPFDSMNDVNRYAVSPLHSSTRYLYEEFERIAHGIGAHSVLGGEGGELGATTWSNRYYLQLAARFRWIRLFSEMRRLRKVSNSSPFRIVAGQLRNVLFPGKTRRPMFLLAQGFKNQFRFRPAFHGRSLSERQYQAELINYWMKKHASRHFNSPDGLVPRSYPLLDKRVIELCLRLPASLNVRGGYHRCFVRYALDGVLPKRIQWRTSKKPFSPDYFVRYNSQLKLATDFVASIAPNDPVRSVIDVDGLETCLREPVDPVKGSLAARMEVPNTLYAINFLRQFSDFRR